jgi:phosphohistidine phosphatase SixA
MRRAYRAVEKGGWHAASSGRTPILPRVRVHLCRHAEAAPGSPDELRTALTGVEGPVATVGHQPDCSEIVEALTAESPPFPPAGSVELELEVT